MCSPVNAYHETVKRFVGADPVDVVARSGASYQNGLYTIDYLHTTYRVDEKGIVYKEDRPGKEVPFNDRTLILQYLCEASGLPPRGRWLSFLELPEGEHHYVPFQTDATKPLAQTFDGHLEEFKLAAKFLGGSEINLGDMSFEIPALPKLPLAVVLWEDDEFPARSNILFDSVASTHLTTAALYMLGIELARKLIAHYDRDKGEKTAITWLEGKSK